jgi:hypothetical protein
VRVRFLQRDRQQKTELLECGLKRGDTHERQLRSDLAGFE